MSITTAGSVTFTRHADITDPDDLLAWLNADGTLRDLSGSTLTMEIINSTTNEIQHLKETGVVGSDGSGLSNLAVAWTVEEMTLLAGPRHWQGRIVGVEDSERSEFVLDAANNLPTWVFQPAPTEPVPEP